MENEVVPAARYGRATPSRSPNCPSSSRTDLCSSRTGRGPGLADEPGTSSALIDDRGDLGFDENAGLEEDLDPDQRGRRRSDIELDGRLVDSRFEGVVHLSLPAGGVPREADDVMERRACRVERLGDVAVDLGNLPG